MAADAASHPRRRYIRGEVKIKVSQNTAICIGINETTCFGLLGGHNQVFKVLID